MEVVDRSTNKYIITSTWIHKLKEDGTAKSRLCPRGFQQEKGKDYNPEEVEAATQLYASPHYF